MDGDWGGDEGKRDGLAGQEGQGEVVVFLVRVRMTSTFCKVTGRKRNLRLLSIASREQYQVLLLPSMTVRQLLASFPGPRWRGEKGLVSTVCACA